MTSTYKSKDVRVLDEIEHIRLNPGMYIGETQTPTHLIEEAIDNSLDEALAGHAKIIAVLIDTKNNRFSVLDDGRGIPLGNNVPVTISSKLFSGAKFQDKKTAYEISSGLHGVGLVAINALSSEYNIEIYRDNKYAIYNFKNTKLKRKKISKFTDPYPFSTKIDFVPDKKLFETMKPNLVRIRQRLTAASAEMPNDISFVLYVDGKKEIFRLSLIDYFKQNCITDKNDIEIFPIQIQKGIEKFNVLFSYEHNGRVTLKHTSSVNLLPVTNGGVHLNCFLDQLKEFFMVKAKKYGFEFQVGDVLVGLRIFLSLSLKEPKFAGQTKDRLINVKSDMEIFTKQMRPQLEKIFPEDKIEEHLSSFQEYRQKIESKKLNKSGTSGKRASTKFTKLRDCTRRDGELYIVEGDSAGGSIIQSRNAGIHAILPLKGKSIPNATTKKDILTNKEVQELIMAIGTGVGPHFDISKIRYDKIICATDADHDGSHITCLVTMVIAILLPEIIKNGKYFIAQTPLFAINEKKLFKPLWNDEEVEKYRKENRIIQRYKGLGEMNPNQLKICLLDIETRNHIPITYSEQIDSLIKLFSSPEEKRKLIGE